MLEEEFDDGGCLADYDKNEVSRQNDDVSAQIRLTYKLNM